MEWKRKRKRLPAYGSDIGSGAGSALEDWEDWNLDWEGEEESQRKEESASDWIDWNDWNVSWEEEKELDMQAEMETEEERERKAEEKKEERERKAMERKVERERKAMERERKANELLAEAMLYLPGPGVVLPKDEESCLNMRLLYYGFMKVKVEQDKHRLFRVFSVNIFGTESHHDFIRQCVADQLKGNRYFYNESRTWKDYASFCDEVSKDHEGEQLVIWAACDLFRVMFVTLAGVTGPAMLETAPTRKLHNEEHIICRKVIYSYVSGKEMHSMVLNPDQHADCVNAHVEFPILSELLDYTNICQNLLRHLPGTAVSKEEIGRRSLRLNTFGFELKKMVGDGNCLFRSLSDQIYGDQELHPCMRSIIVEKLKAHPKWYSELRRETVQETYNNYCSRMAKDKEWGGDACLQAASDAFGVKIIQLCSVPGLIFNEHDPIGPCKEVIYVCTKTHHMDAMSIHRSALVTKLPVLDEAIYTGRSASSLPA